MEIGTLQFSQFRARAEKAMKTIIIVPEKVEEKAKQKNKMFYLSHKDKHVLTDRTNIESNKELISMRTLCQVEEESWSDLYSKNPQAILL